MAKAMAAANKPYKMIMMPDTDHYFQTQAQQRQLFTRSRISSPLLVASTWRASRWLAGSTRPSAVPERVRPCSRGWTVLPFVGRRRDGAGLLLAPQVHTRATGAGRVALRAWRPPHNKTKEWSHEVMDIARHRRVAVGCPFRGRRARRRHATDEEINEEIMVTAQKRATVAAGSAILRRGRDGEDIKESGATNIVDVARNVPGLYIADLGPGQSQVAIRGISAGQVVRDQPGVKESVGIYLDESPISVALFTPDLDLYDLDRIEVLRGPQGTLFGAGSTSGTVRYITAQPNIGKFGGSVDFTLDGATDGDIGGALRGALNVPLGEKRRHARRGLLQRTAGIHRFLYPGRGTREDVNSGSRTGGRLAFRFEPTENIAITPRIVYQKLETDGYPRIDAYNILGNPYTTTEPRWIRANAAR